MKKLIVKWVLPFAIEELIKALRKLAKKTDNRIDDNAVDQLEVNKEQIITEIKAAL